MFHVKLPALRCQLNALITASTPLNSPKGKKGKLHKYGYTVLRQDSEGPKIEFPMPLMALYCFT